MKRHLSLIHLPRLIAAALFFLASGGLLLYLLTGVFRYTPKLLLPAIPLAIVVWLAWLLLHTTLWAGIDIREGWVVFDEGRKATRIRFPLRELATVTLETGVNGALPHFPLRDARIVFTMKDGKRKYCLVRRLTRRQYRRVLSAFASCCSLKPAKIPSEHIRIDPTPKETALHGSRSE